MTYHHPIQTTDTTVFFTACLADDRSTLFLDEADTLRWAVGKTLGQFPVGVLAWVTLPSRLHTIWRLPPGDQSLARRWGAIKSRFSHALDARGTRPPVAAGRRGASGLWQPGVWEFPLHGPDDLATHKAFCRHAPVEAGLVSHPGDWPLSSFAQEVRTRRTG